MIIITYDQTHKAFILEPDGPLSDADIEALKERVDDFINETDTIPSLIIHAVEFPGWEDFGAIVNHIKFVKEHHSLIPRVALVSDSSVLSALPHIADHFVKAQIRRFPEDQLEAAKEWVSDPEAPEGKVEWIEGLPADVLALRVSGTVTGQHYENEIVPAIEEKLKRHDKIKLLYQIGDEFESYTAGAMWDDTKLGFTHLHDFSRIAVVTDLKWVKLSAKVFGPLIGGDLHVFDNAQIEEAKEWIKA